LCGEVDGLLAGAALAVDGRRRDVVGKSRAQPRHSAGGGGLLAHLGDTADQHVVDGARVEIVTYEQPRQCLCEQIDRMDIRQGATGAAASAGCTDRVDDDRVSAVLRSDHGYCLS
jgi:hypothetical protein